MPINLAVEYPKLQNDNIILRCQNDELILMLKKVKGFLEIIPSLRRCNTSGFDDCINISEVIKLKDEIINTLEGVPTEI